MSLFEAAWPRFLFLIPVGFRRLDYLDLTDWGGAPRDHRLDRLLDELEQKTGRPPSLDLKAVRACEETWRRFGAPTLKAFALEAPLEVSEGDRKQGQQPVIARRVPASAPPLTRDG